MSDSHGNVKVDDIFIAKGCERRSHVLDWSWRLNLVIFASAGDICLAVVQGVPRIFATKATHLHSITHLKVFSWTKNVNQGNCDFLVTGDSGGVVFVHKVFLQKDATQIVSVAKYVAESKQTITCCCGHVIQSCQDGSLSLVIAFAASDGKAYVCYGTSCNETYAAHKISNVFLEPALALCVQATFFQGSVIFAVSISDCNIKIFAASEEQSLNHLLTLKGHSNWVTDLSFKNTQDMNEDSMLLASAGQDNVLRLWRFTKNVSGKKCDEDLSFSSKVYESDLLTAELEAILTGHEDFVFSVQWHPFENEVLSASADKSLIIWKPLEEGQGVWLEKFRVGEVGGLASGYNRGCFSPDGRVILAVSYFGGFYGWFLEQAGSNIWRPLALFGGHSLGVCDLSWDPSGTYLLTCSLDQTSRCFSPSLYLGHAEIARPQVHGHDFSCIASVSTSCFVSGSEEKILRVFQAPFLFAKSLANISGCSFEKIFPDTSCLAPQGASVPALGLSNKQIENADSVPFVLSSRDEKEIFVSPGILKEVPTEEQLMQSTLWPEIQKLYGHVFEIFTVASNFAGTQVASACKRDSESATPCSSIVHMGFVLIECFKASQKEHAVILLWDTRSWKKIATLVSHQLTVAQLAFSHNDQMLASVSRDRTFTVFKQSFCNWSLLYKSGGGGETHSRIIWSCAWTADDKYLATASRDRKLAVWRITEAENSVLLTCTSKRDAPVTAVDCCSCFERYVIAIGLETGVIEIMELRSNELISLLRLDQSTAHSRTIRRLKFRPTCGSWSPTPSKENICELASAGLDNAVKVYRLIF